MNAKKDIKTAAETYAARRTEIARLIDVLQMYLDMPHKTGGPSWGEVGNLEKVRSDLVNLVGFMSNMDPEHVEDFLNNAE